MPFPFYESSSAEEAGPSLLSALFEIHRGRKTGVLHLMEGTGLYRVWFSDGHIQHAEGFKEILKGVVSVDPPGGFSGDLLKDLGQVIAFGVTPQEALRAAHEGVVALMVRVGVTESPGWGFEEGVEAPPGSMGLSGAFLSEVVHAIERTDNVRAIQRRLRGMEARVLSFQGEILSGDGFPPMALRIRRLARKRKSLQEVVSGLGGENQARTDAVWKSIGLLHCLGVVEFNTPASPRNSGPLGAGESLGDGADEETTQSFSGETLSERRRNRASMVAEKELLQQTPPEPAAPSIPDDPKWFYKKAAEIEAMNPLLAIGLEPDEIDGAITPAVARSAFRQRAAEYHPDRLSHFSAESREAAEGVFSAFSELRSRLSSQEDIDKALKLLVQERTGVKEITEFDRERARVMGRKAAGFMRFRKWEPAKELLRQAQALDPENVMLKLHERFCSGILHEVPFADAAVAIEALEPKGKANQAERLYRSGWLWKLAGKEKQALRCFVETLNVDPNNVDAKREVRLLQKRMDGGSEKREVTIPFGRFFKKK